MVGVEALAVAVEEKRVPGRVWPTACDVVRIRLTRLQTQKALEIGMFAKQVQRLGAQVFPMRGQCGCPGLQHRIVIRLIGQARHIQELGPLPGVGWRGVDLAEIPPQGPLDAIDRSGAELGSRRFEGLQQVRPPSRRDAGHDPGHVFDEGGMYGTEVEPLAELVGARDCLVVGLGGCQAVTHEVQHVTEQQPGQRLVGSQQYRLSQQCGGRVRLVEPAQYLRQLKLRFSVVGLGSQGKLVVRPRARPVLSLRSKRGHRASRVGAAGIAFLEFGRLDGPARYHSLWRDNDRSDLHSPRWTDPLFQGETLLIFVGCGCGDGWRFIPEMG